MKTKLTMMELIIIEDIDYVHGVAVYQKYLTRLGELIVF